jgi:deoxycytidine triphosphate deaminase
MVNMSILSDKEIRRLAVEHRMLEPFVDHQVRQLDNGQRAISHGLSSYGYDLRVADEFKVFTNVFNTVVASCRPTRSRWREALSTSAYRETSSPFASAKVPTPVAASS